MRAKRGTYFENEDRRLRMQLAYVEVEEGNNHQKNCHPNTRGLNPE
jgi:hypothetical protein